MSASPEYGILWTLSGQISPQRSREIAVGTIESWQKDTTRQPPITGTLMVRSGPDAEWRQAGEGE